MKTLKLRIKDKHCKVLDQLASEVNFVWNYVNDFLYGDITREQFWELAKFKYPTHQISFHTLAGLNCLTFERSETIYDRNQER